MERTVQEAAQINANLQVSEVLRWTKAHRPVKISTRHNISLQK